MNSNDESSKDRDKDLFLDAIGNTKPLKHKHVVLRKHPPKAYPFQQIKDEQAVIDDLLTDPSEADLLDTGEHLSFKRPGVQNSVLRKLRIGRYTIQKELDLHGLNRTQAKIEIIEFIQDCRQRDKYCVRIIHGKGRRNADSPPVLKPSVNHWLSSHKYVLAFCSAPIHDGGTGAVYVLLKK